MVPSPQLSFSSRLCLQVMQEHWQRTTNMLLSCRYLIPSETLIIDMLLWSLPLFTGIQTGQTALNCSVDEDCVDHAHCSHRNGTTACVCNTTVSLQMSDGTCGTYVTEPCTYDILLYQYGSIKMRINNQLTYKQTCHPYCWKMLFPAWMYAMPFIYARYHKLAWYRLRHRQAKKTKVDFFKKIFCKSVSDCSQACDSVGLLHNWITVLCINVSC